MTGSRILFLAPASRNLQIRITCPAHSFLFQIPSRPTGPNFLVQDHDVSDAPHFNMEVSDTNHSRCRDSGSQLRPPHQRAHYALVRANRHPICPSDPQPTLFRIKPHLSKYLHRWQLWHLPCHVLVARSPFSLTYFRLSDCRTNTPAQQQCRSCPVIWLRRPSGGDIRCLHGGVHSGR